jgi:hypothetical protein
LVACGGPSNPMHVQFCIRSLFKLLIIREL